MNRVTIITSVLFTTVTIANASTAPLYRLSGLESQAVTPVITDNPDQTIHLQPNISHPDQLDSGASIPTAIHSDIVVTPVITDNPNHIIRLRPDIPATYQLNSKIIIPSTTNSDIKTPNMIDDNIHSGTGPNSMDEHGNTTNNSTSIGGSTVDLTTPNSVDESGNFTNDSEIDTHLITTPSGTSSTSNVDISDTNNGSSLNTNLNKSTKETDSTDSPPVNVPSTLNNDSGTANDSDNQTSTPILNPETNTLVPAADWQYDAILDSDEDIGESGDVFQMDDSNSSLND